MTLNRKTFFTMQNVGSAKYVVSFHDGVKTHKDGSMFYDVRIFTNKRKMEQFTRELIMNGFELR
jgi:hypothetical protein